MISHRRKKRKVLMHRRGSAKASPGGGAPRSESIIVMIELLPVKWTVK